MFWNTDTGFLKRHYIAPYVNYQHADYTKYRDRDAVLTTDK